MATLLRDIICFLLWVFFKIGSVVFIAVIACANIKGMFYASETEYDIGVFLSSILSIAVAVWINHNTTAVPLLLWRYRKHHVFRSVPHRRNSEYRSMQIRLYGLWFYLTCKQGDILMLTTNPTEELKMTEFFYDFAERETERKARQIMERIRPTEVNGVSDQYVFEGTSRKK